MIFWPLAGVLTALATGLAVAPMARRHPHAALILCLGLSALALGLYFRLGSPEAVNAVFAGQILGLRP